MALGPARRNGGCAAWLAPSESRGRARNQLTAKFIIGLADPSFRSDADLAPPETAP